MASSLAWPVTASSSRTAKRPASCSAQDEAGLPRRRHRATVQRQPRKTAAGLRHLGHHGVDGVQSRRPPPCRPAAPRHRSSSARSGYGREPLRGPGQGARCGRRSAGADRGAPTRLARHRKSCGSWRFRSFTCCNARVQVGHRLADLLIGAAAFFLNRVAGAVQAGRQLPRGINGGGQPRFGFRTAGGIEQGIVQRCHPCRERSRIARAGQRCLPAVA